MYFVYLACLAFSIELLPRVASLRLHEIQYLGTHNSYHVAPDPELDAVEELDARLGQLVDASKYTHPSLLQQLEDYNVRSIEIDVYEDREGGKYTFRGVRALLELGDVFDQSTEMQQPGFKTMHIDNIDYGTTCLTLVSCLTIINDWSNSNPTHTPLILRVEMKRQTVIEILEEEDPAAAGAVIEELQELQTINPEFPADLPRTDPPISTTTAELLLQEILSVISLDKLVKPDDVRGDSEFLRQALNERGPDAFWPEIDDIRGKIVLIVAGLGPELVGLYGGGLVGSPAFTRHFLQPDQEVDTLGIPGDIVFVEHYTAGSSRILASLMAEGFFVLAHADLGGEQARTDDRSTYEQIVAAGPNVIQTEFLEPPSEPGWSSSYFVRLPCGELEVFCVLPSNSTYVAPEEQVELPDVPNTVEARDGILQRQDPSGGVALPRARISLLLAAAIGAWLVL